MTPKALFWGHFIPMICGHSRPVLTNENDVAPLLHIVALHKLSKEPHIQVGYSIEIEGFKGLEKGEFGFLDSPTQPAFRPGLNFAVRQLQKKLITADPALFGLTQQNIQVPSHS
jgi:hypothetical protein